MNNRMNSTVTCPQCGSEDVAENIPTDIPDKVYDYGCRNCSHLWDKKSIQESLS